MNRLTHWAYQHPKTATALLVLTLPLTVVPLCVCGIVYSVYQLIVLSKEHDDWL